MALSDIMNGKIVKNVPNEVWEVMFMSTLHMSAQEAKNISQRDFNIYAPLVDMIFRTLCNKGL